MNKELKAIIDEMLDIEHLAVDALGKKDFSAVLIADLINAGKDIPAVVSSYADLKQEIKDLANPMNQSDLEAYILSKVVGTSAKAQAIINAAIHLIEGGEELYKALKL